jgi:tRNA 2-selenouridine synthase
MAVEKADIKKFLQLLKDHPVLDVRSPKEYAHAHIPGAYSLPLFTDEERAVIGTAYKQRSRAEAVKHGLNYFGPNMIPLADKAKDLIEEHYRNRPNKNDNVVVVHCWRGGMRSAAVAWLLDLFGYKVILLGGGYKAYRTWALELFAQPNTYKIIGGYTGSGKTELLIALGDADQRVVDLEGLANHKGSAFGNIGLPVQPTQEMFENKLALAISEQLEKSGGAIWLEDESQRIGLVNIPKPLWEIMRTSSLYFLDIPFEKRLEHIVEEYGKLDLQEMLSAIERIKDKLGGQNAKLTSEYLLEGKIKESFEILLQYYDKFYHKSLLKRENLKDVLTKIDCIDTGASNCSKLLEKK